MNFKTLLISLAGLVCSATQLFAQNDNLLSELKSRFAPEKPTVSISYDVGYRFLFLNLMSLARATIDTTEGVWSNSITGQTVPACFIEFTFRTHDCEEGATDRNRISIDDKIVSVLTMPDLNTLMYIKKTDECLNPLIGHRKESKNLFVYDLESGNLNYRLEDYLADTVTTNLPGTGNLVEQGKDVSHFLKIMSEIYYGKQEMITPDSDFRIHCDVDGAVRAFCVKTESTTLAIKLLGANLPAIRVSVEPAKGEPIRSVGFQLWASSLQDVAQASQDSNLRELSAKVPDWSMVPLLADYGLSVGYIRCSMSKIQAIDQTAKGLALLAHEN
ncbi:MAG TPA: hypothetical protein DCZ95_02180 [Verrucomicrobia bacterium]|nr:MAG: hypothetical protein A2X46_00665 [Lentisphaerae bacterium GWF2_57_35]HBA82879.1 hypothetical protein [Verrucomicrobiota bacterium]